MLMGMSPEEKKLLGLGMASDYHYLTMVSPQLLFPTCSSEAKGGRDGLAHAQTPILTAEELLL